MFPLEQGAFEMVLIGVFALIVVGPKDLPVLMRRVGQALAKMRGLAAEFRASFDEMARQSELDELRKEVEALRSGATPTLSSIHSDIEGGLDALHHAYNPPPASPAPEPQGFAFPPSPLAYEPPVFDPPTPVEPPEPDVVAKPDPKPRRKAAKPVIEGEARKPKRARAKSPAPETDA